MFMNSQTGTQLQLVVWFLFSQTSNVTDPNDTDSVYMSGYNGATCFCEVDYQIWYRHTILSNKWNPPPCFLWLDFFFFQNDSFAKSISFMVLFFFFFFRKWLLNAVFIITTIARQKNHTSFKIHDFVNNYQHGRFRLLQSIFYACLGYLRNTSRLFCGDN